MRKEEVVSSVIMFVVCGLVMVGFTIAWYTSNYEPVVTGISMEAEELAGVKVALSSGGQDISELTGGAQYADIGVEKFSNLDAGKLAPGTYGSVMFYITPGNDAVTACSIVPQIHITQDGESWYPDNTQESEDTDMKKLYDIAQSHICFFADEEMTEKVTADNPYRLTWAVEDNLAEKEAVLYWKWYYEYPFTEEEKVTLSEEGRVELKQYDEEDMELGNNVSGMKFHFTFSAQ